MLASLDGLSSLREVSIIDIQNNASLASLELNTLEHIEGLYLGACLGVSFDSSATVGDNPALTKLDGFDSLVSLTSLSVSGQNSLTSIARLQELAESGVEFAETEFQLNENLDTAEIEAFMNAAGSFGTVCENAGDDTKCMCPSGR